MKPTFCVNTVVSNLLTGYVQGPDWSALREELEAHTYVSLQWKILADPSTTETDSKFSNIKRILFVNTDSVIVQDVELTIFCTRFTTHKIYFEDWAKCFTGWDDGERKWLWDECWANGCRMYGANV